MSHEQELTGTVAESAGIVGTVLPISAPVLKKGEGVDSIVQVITTESGNPDLDNKPIATGEGAMALGKFCVVEGHNSHAVNYYNRITASRAFAANENNEVHGYCGAAFGAANVITEEAQRAAVFGAQNTVSGPYAFGAGRYTKVSGENAFGCGQSTQAKGLNSFVCGKDSVAGARETFAGGNGSQALKQFDFAFGNSAIANGGAAFVAGLRVQAQAAYAWVGGLDNIATGQAMVWGRGLLSNGGWQAVFGKYNVTNKNALLIIGNGTADDARSNAFMVLDNAIVVGGKTLTADTIANVATKSYIEEYINSLGVAEGVAF